MSIVTNLHLTSIVLVGYVLAIFTPAQCIASHSIPVIKATSDRLAARNRDLTDVSIGGIKIGMKLSQVTKKLGQPIQIEKIPNLCSGGEIITLKYYKFTIVLHQGIVLGIDSSNPIYQTGEKIRIGDPLRKAQKTYDKILMTPSNYSEHDRELLYNKSADGILRFKSKLGRITSMSITVDDC
jgi:hypothetical protein